MVLNVQRLSDKDLLIRFTDTLGKYLSRYAVIYDTEADAIENLPVFYQNCLKDIKGLAKITASKIIEKSHKFKAGAKHYTIVYETDKSIILYCHETNAWMRFTNTNYLW